MKLLLDNTRIVGTATDDYVGPMEFITAPDGFDVNRMADYQVIDGVLTVIVPASVTMRQARLQLLAIGKLAEVDTAVATMGQDAQIAWDYSSIVERNHALIAPMQQLLGYTDAQMDELFIAASKL
jgi:hypothetical protein